MVVVVGVVVVEVVTTAEFVAVTGGGADASVAGGCGVDTGCSWGVGVDGVAGEGELGSPLAPSPSSELSSELRPDISPPFLFLLFGVEGPEASSEPLVRLILRPFLSSPFFGAGEAECRDVLLSGVLLSGVLRSGVGHSSVMSGVFALDRRTARCLVLISLALVRVRIRRSSSFGVGGGRPVPGGGSRGLVMTGRSPYRLKWMRHS